VARNRSSASPAGENDLAFGAAAHRVGDGPRAGVLGLQRCDHGVHQGTRRRWSPTRCRDGSIRDAPASPISSSMVAKNSSLVAGQEPPVHHPRAPRSGITFGPCSPPCSMVGLAVCCASVAPISFGHAAQPGHRGVQVVRVQRDTEGVGDLVKERPHGSWSSGSGKVCPPIRVTARGQCGHRVCPRRSSTRVQPRPGRGQPQPGHALLRGLDGVEAACPRR